MLKLETDELTNVVLQILFHMFFGFIGKKKIHILRSITLFHASRQCIIFIYII